MSRTHALVQFSAKGSYVLFGTQWQLASVGHEAQAGEVMERVWEMCALKRRPAGEPVRAATHADPGQLLEVYPALAEWLSAAVYEDGSPRQYPTATLFLRDGQWRLSLRDRDQRLVAWVAADSWDRVLDAAEAVLSDPAFRWRHDDDASPDTKGKRSRSS